MTEVAAAVLVSDRAHANALTGLSAAGRAVPAALLVSLPGLVFLAGFDHLAYGLGLLAGIVLAGLLIAPHVAREGAATALDAVQRRFGHAASYAALTVTLLVVLPLLTAELTLIGIVSEAGLGVPYLAAVLGAVATSAAAALLLRNRALGWLAIGAFTIFTASLLIPLMLMAIKSGSPAPPIAYGQALSAIVGLEEKLVENGLVDFDTFAMHATPFLRLSGLDLVALVVSLALGTAVLPQLVAALAAKGSPAAARFTGAWASLFVLLVLMSAPALAAYAKLEVYTSLTQGTPLAELPAWLEAPLRAGVARIHGTSIYLLSAVADAVRAGHADPAAILGYLATDATASAQWVALDDTTREAMLAAARTLASDASRTSAWTLYLTAVLPPAAASAAGNTTAMLTQAALVIEPVGLLLSVPGLAGIPASGLALLMTGVLAAALVMAAALLHALANALGADELATPPPWRVIVLVSVIGVFAAGLAAARPGELVTIVVSALSLAAAGLFPVLAIGLAWKRATAAGAMAAILLGAGVTLYYDVGIQVVPAAFYRTWAPLSNASEFAAEEFATLEAEARDAPDAESRKASETALETLARGTATRRGLANWLGVDSASGAVFGVPLGIITLVVVSLLTRRRPLQP